MTQRLFYGFVCVLRAAFFAETRRSLSIVADSVFALQVGSPDSLKGDAERAMKRFVAEGGSIATIEDDFQVDQSADLIVDALFGIG